MLLVTQPPRARAISKEQTESHCKAHNRPKEKHGSKARHAVLRTPRHDTVGQEVE